MEKITRSVLLGMICIAPVIFSSCSSRSREIPAASARDAGITRVSGVVMVPQVLENSVRSSGTVLASESVDLIAESAGRIEKISFREGARVRENDLLVQINDDDLQTQLRKNELQIQLSEEQEQRQKKLFEKDGISREQYDISLNQLNILRAERENLLVSIRKRELRAPFDGIVGLRYVSEGGYVSQTTRIASLQKIDPLKIDFSIPEKYAGQVNVGDPVQFVHEGTKKQISGKIYAVEPRIDPQTRTLQLRALFENRSGSIFPGAYVQIEVRLKKTSNALLVPTQAIIPVLKGQTVLVCRNGQVAVITVQTGTRTASAVQVVSGLSAGDTVITTGLMQLREGMRVSVAVQK